MPGKSHTERLAMPYRRSKRRPEGKHLHNVHFPHFALPPLLSRYPTHRVLYPSLLSSYLLIEHAQSLRSIYPSIWQHDWIVLDYTLGVMGVWYVARQLVQLGAADWANGCGGGGSVGRR